MPRKRRQPKRRLDELAAAMVELLLTGDSQIDPFLEFDTTPEEIAAAWRDHGAALRAEQKRRGLDTKEMDQ